MGSSFGTKFKFDLKTWVWVENINDICGLDHIDAIKTCKFLAIRGLCLKYVNISVQ